MRAPLWAWLIAVSLTFSCTNRAPAPEQVKKKSKESAESAEAPPTLSQKEVDEMRFAGHRLLRAAYRQLLSPEEIAAGWIALYDGVTTLGWKPNTDDDRWSRGKAPLRLSADDPTTPNEDVPGLLLTTTVFADYELRFDVRLEEGGNSGVFLRTPRNPQDPAVDCYEFNICDSHETYPTGSLVGRKRIEADIQAEGQWTTFHLRVEGSTIQAEMNGQPILEFTDTSENRRRIGHIGLQQNEGRVEFRNVFLKPLGTSPIFNGSDLTGWREVPGSQAEFNVEDGTLHVTGGPGFLETERTWDDFVLQLEVRTNVEETNSGIFFRAQPGTEEAPSNGYELQIHNGYEGDDRTKPNDYGAGFGTGAIFRRQPARRIVADDNEWFTLTLAAHGPHFASWVNGYQVTDWTDDREPHENPRRGKRLEAGHISLQGHDETTDVSFRHIRLAPLPNSNPDSDE